MLSTILMILSFFVAKKKGASTGAALGIAAGVGAASWFLADPSNPNSKWGDATAKWFGMDRATSEAVQGTSTAASLLGKTVDGATDVAKSWGATGVIGGALAVKHSDTVVGWAKDNWPWLVGLSALYILAK